MWDTVGPQMGKFMKHVYLMRIYCISVLLFVTRIDAYSLEYSVIMENMRTELHHLLSIGTSLPKLTNIL